MSDLTLAATRLISRQHGVITFDQLRDAGVGLRTIQRLVDRGVFVRWYKSVVRHRAVPTSLQTQCAAVCLAHPRALVTGATAGRLSGLRRMPDDAERRIRALAPHGLHLEHRPDVTFRQTTKLHPTDVVRRGDGITIASPARLAFDLARELAIDDLSSVIEQLLDRGLCTVDELMATARRLVHPARRGSSVFLRAIGDRGSGPPSESNPELAVFEALRQRGVPVLHKQVTLRLPNGSLIRVDLSIPELRWGIEVDVHPDHLLLEGTTRDKRRDRQAHLIGWQVERVTELDLRALDPLADELYALYLERLRSFHRSA